MYDRGKSMDMLLELMDMILKGLDLLVFPLKGCGDHVIGNNDAEANDNEQGEHEK